MPPLVRRLRACSFAVAGVLVLLGIRAALANPQGGAVAAGHATIARAGSSVIVTQGSNRAVINWNSFSIAAGQTTRFALPAATAAVLNRVVGADPSAILGMLSSNGQVFLLNPHGILIGPGGRVDTAGFVASTLNVPDQQFMHGGAMTLQGGSAAGVVNKGTIRATDGSVLLLGNSVTNSGAIDAPRGTVGLGAGGKVLLVDPGVNARFFVLAPGPGGKTGIDQAGRIAAVKAALKAAGGNLYALAINNTGLVQATAVQHVGGRILLTAPGGAVRDSGILRARNGDVGGTVAVLGGKVALTGHALVDVRGARGGGTALIGAG